MQGFDVCVTEGVVEIVDVHAGRRTWPHHRCYHRGGMRARIVVWDAGCLIFSSAFPVPDGHHTSFTTIAIPVPSRCTRPLFGHGPSYKNYVRRPPDSQLKRQYPLPTPGPSIRRYIVLGCGSFVRGRKRKKGDSIPFIVSRRDYISRLPDECP